MTAVIPNQLQPLEMAIPRNSDQDSVSFESRCTVSAGATGVEAALSLASPYLLAKCAN
ncbi:hypothetical protein CBM2586_B130584 [Cupriavidus phytorum]|uniref:Uncharacterized protein n=1 Tax=Cupriavidus taiwanensis TaxID=164546 RepID=A0A975XIA9_9BURK|nr:hypothetical protein CBM2586_B130584 [Cupriavidus taiwanensis]